MYKYLLVFFLALVTASAQDYCTITATVKLLDGKTPAIGAKVIVTRADRSGSLYANTTREYRTNTSGVATFTAPRTTGTDSAYINVRVTDATGMILSAERTVGVPNAATATLESLLVSNTYTSALVLIPALFAHAQSDSLQIYSSIAFSDAFQIRRDAQGRVRVDRDPDSSAASSGVSAAALKDSMNAEMSTGARLARRISDSLNANPRSNLFDTLNIHQRAHTWTAEQRYAVPITFVPASNAVTVQSFKSTDTSRLFQFYTRAYPGVNASGFQDDSWYMGWNPLKVNTSLPGIWDVWEENFIVNGVESFELNRDARGKVGAARRVEFSNISRDSARGVQKSFAYDRITFFPGNQNAGGASPSLEFTTSDGAITSNGNVSVGKGLSVLQGATISNNLSVGRVTSGVIYSTGDSLYLNSGSMYIVPKDGGDSAVITVNPSGDVHSFKLSRATYDDVIVQGGNGGYILGAWDGGTLNPDFMELRSGAYRLQIDSYAGALTTNAPTWGIDSTALTSKGYVDTRIAAVSGGGISAAVLTDSLNANPRRDNGKLNITALTDTISANVTRGATIKADTASLAVVADKMYPRTATGGSGISSDSLTAALTLNTGRAIGAEIDVPSGTRARIDSAAIRVLMRDTLVSAVSDSGFYSIRWIERPQLLAGLGDKIGEVEVTLTGRCNPIQTFNIRFDSANNVLGSVIETSTIGWTGTLYGKRLAEGTIWSSSTSLWGVGTVLAQSNLGQDNRRVSITRAGANEVGTGIGTRAAAPMKAYSVEGTAGQYYRTTIRIMFTQTAASASEWYVKITDL